MGVGTLRRNREEAEARAKADDQKAAASEVEAGKKVEPPQGKTPSKEPVPLEAMKHAELLKEAEKLGIDTKPLTSKKKALEAIQAKLAPPSPEPVVPANTIDDPAVPDAPLTVDPTAPAETVTVNSGPTESTVASGADDPPAAPEGDNASADTPPETPAKE